MLLIGDVPNGGEPDAKLGAGLVENSARRCRRLMSACRANQSAATHSLDWGCHTALWADQTTTPSQLLKVIPTRLFRVKPIKKLNPSRWVICPAYRGCLCGVHRAILPLVELKGYPINIYSTVCLFKFKEPMRPVWDEPGIVDNVRQGCV